MPPRKASGLGADSAHEARRRDLLGRRIDAEAIPRRPLNQRRVSVYDGQTALGSIELIGGNHVAINATGQTLGTFATLKAAVASN